MTDEELRRMKKNEILDRINRLEDELAATKTELVKAKRALEDKRIALSECGSIAEASMAISDVFAKAQEAADVYLDNIKAVSADSKAHAEAILAEANKNAAATEADMKAKVSNMLAEAKQTVADKEVEAKKIEEDTIAKCQSMVDEAKTYCEKLKTDALADVRTQQKEMTKQFSTFMRSMITQFGKDENE